MDENRGHKVMNNVVLFTPVASGEERMALCLGELASLEEQVQDGVARAADATVESLSLRRDRDHPEMVRLIASVRRRKVLQLERAAATRDVLAGLFERGLDRAMRSPHHVTKSDVQTLLRPVSGGQYLVNALLRDFGPDALTPENDLVLNTLARHAAPNRRYTVLVPGAGVAGMSALIARTLVKEDESSGLNAIVVDAVDTSLPSLALGAGILRAQAEVTSANSFRIFPDASLTGLLRVAGSEEADPSEDGGVSVSPWTPPADGQGDGQGAEHGGGGALPQGALLRLWHAAFRPGSLPNLPPRHACVTRFFLDAVPDVFQAVDAVHARLCASGLWINLGPLKYHGYHARGPRPTWEEIRTFATRVLGFTLLEEKVLDRVSYFRGHEGSNASVLGETYRCTFTVMMKKAE